MEQDKSTLTDVMQFIARIDERMNAFQNQLTGALKRIDEGTKRDQELHEIRRTLDVMNANIIGRLERMEANQVTADQRITQHGKEIDELRQKPAKRWESLVGYLISAIVGALIVFAAGRLGMK